MGQFSSPSAQCTLSSTEQCVALEPVPFAANGAVLLLLSQDFPQGSHPSCSDPRGSAVPVLPLAMIQHINHSGSDLVEGPTLSSNTSGNNCWEDNCYRWVTLWSPGSRESYPTSPGAPPGWKRSEGARRSGKSLSESGTGVLSQR